MATTHDTTTTEIRLYENPDTRARLDSGDISEISLHGWDHADGATLTIDGRPCTLTDVGGSIRTADIRGSYVIATAEDGASQRLTETNWETIEEWQRDRRINRLMHEAGVAGDGAMVRTCAAALDGDVQAIAECVAVLAAAEANARDD